MLLYIKNAEYWLCTAYPYLRPRNLPNIITSHPRTPSQLPLSHWVPSVLSLFHLSSLLAGGSLNIQVMSSLVITFYSGYLWLFKGGTRPLLWTLSHLLSLSSYVVFVCFVLCCFVLCLLSSLLFLSCYYYYNIIVINIIYSVIIIIAIVYNIIFYLLYIL